MTIRTLLPAMAATVAIGFSGAAVAQSAGVAGLGVADADDRGAAAAAGVEARAQDRDQRDRRSRHWPERRMPVPNAASTYGAGSVYTDRNRTSAAVSSGGVASGDGTQSTATTVDAYGETGRDGSSADIYGASTATSEEARRPRRPE